MAQCARTNLPPSPLQLHIRPVAIAVNLVAAFACGVAWAAGPAYRDLRRDAGGLALPGLWQRAVRAAGPTGRACAAFAGATMGLHYALGLWWVRTRTQRARTQRRKTPRYKARACPPDGLDHGVEQGIGVRVRGA
jgi:hypothetical protein